MKRLISTILLLALGIFLVWRFIRPMNIFIVDERFAWPVDTTQSPPVLSQLSSRDCGACHQAFYDEWRTTIHSQAWTDPYFQSDWKFDNAQYICRLCHTPLDRQQPQRVLGYRDKDRWDPILKDNPDFDRKLQHEGVTCAACHYRDGKIVGVLGDTNTPHPVRKLEDPNQVCVRCHIVEGDRWDTFFRFPPCGTVAEIEGTLAAVPDRQDLGDLAIQAAKKYSDREKVVNDSDETLVLESAPRGRTGETIEKNTRSLGCVQCHMPLIRRPLVKDGEVRNSRRHLWRGGHDPQMVKKALSVEFVEKPRRKPDTRLFLLTLTNTGATHYVPTGTPDRHLTVHLRLLDEQDGVLYQEDHRIERRILWRPFIVDLWDNRLRRGQPQGYELEVPVGSGAVKAEAEIRYHLLAESRRKRIGYENETPIDYAVFHKQIQL